MKNNFKTTAKITIIINIRFSNLNWVELLASAYFVCFGESKWVSLNIPFCTKKITCSMTTMILV